MDDMLEDRRTNGDLLWVTKPFRAPQYKYCKSKSPNEIKDDVFKSKIVQHSIEEIIVETGKSKDELIEEALSILEQMGHNFNLKSARLMGYILAKGWKKIYRGIYVDKVSIEAVKDVVPNYPILLMPTHRSYIDFLVLSYCFFHYEIPLPIIAGGQDFMDMSVVGNMLRNSGAFFIRRSFGKDKLYWAIFAAYVRTIMVNGDAPLEFFVEGTRSRSAKSLTPKFGLLTAALESFFKADVPDIYIVPVSITYDRTLEEELYAYELLGVPKPKESTRGLLKARKIFNNDYGNFYLKFGSPFSLRDFCGDKIDRSIHNFCRHLSPVSPEEHKVIEELGRIVVKKQQNNLILPPFVFIATILVINMQQDNMEISLLQLLEEFRWLLNLLGSHGPFSTSSEVNKITSTNDSDAVLIIKDVCNVHNNVVKVMDDRVGILDMRSKLSPAACQQYGLSEETLKRSVSNILLSHYSNQMLHLMVPEGLIVCILKSNPDTAVTKDVLYSEYQFLTTVLQLDFIFFKDESAQEEFEKAVSFLRTIDAIGGSDDAISSVTHCRVIHFLLQLYEPFLVAYNLVCHVLLDSGKIQSPLTAKSIAKAAQAEGERLLIKERLYMCTILSMDTLMNAVGSLALMGALKKEQRNGTLVYNPCYTELFPLTRRLAPYSRWSGTPYLKDVSDIWLDARAKL
ncbi:hypothetical protein CHUAL_010195 [Chamberlinius hualienensis]